MLPQWNEQHHPLTKAAVKKAQQHLHLLRPLRRKNLEEKPLVSFSKTTVESVLTSYIATWYAGSSAADLRKLRVALCPTGGKHIIKDSSHPGNYLFEQLPTGRRYSSQTKPGQAGKEFIFEGKIH